MTTTQRENTMSDTTLRRGDTITIDGREWFDKTYGNSYCSARVSINGTEVGRVPFGYGYGNAYRQYAMELLTELGMTYCVCGGTIYQHDNIDGIETCSGADSRSMTYAGITIVSNIATGQLKRDVTAWGTA